MKKKPKPKPSVRRKAPAPKGLLYKVVELSTVDETALEQTINDWAQLGWTFDGVQFAMRESSRRPAMGFVFFTREVDRAEAEGQGRPRDETAAERHLMQLAGLEPRPTSPPVSAYQRLIELAEGDEDRKPGGR